MAKRLNIERSIGNSIFKTRIGSVNRLNPASIYVTGKAYISPTFEKEDYSEDIDELDKDLKTILRRYVKSNSFLNNMFISNLELPKNGLKQGKNTYMCFQLFFSQKFGNDICTSMDKIKEKMSPLVSGAMGEFENVLHERGFTIHEKRKEIDIYSKI